MRSILIAVVIILQLLLGWWYCQDFNRYSNIIKDEPIVELPIERPQIQSQLAPTIPDEINPAAPVDGRNANPGSSVDRSNTQTEPISFRWDGENHILGNGWAGKRQALLDGLNDNQQLEITGLYHLDEANNTSFENLGLARANGVKKLFSPPLDNDRLVLRGKLREAANADRTRSFESVSFRNLTNTAKIKETGDRTLIYFPYNSTKRINDSDLEAYLDDVADRVKASGESIRLTGHTDSFGSAEYNLRLGEYRADIVRSYLISKGVSSSKITSQSKGETTPVSSNKTKKGRADNRRTELQIIK